MRGKIWPIVLCLIMNSRFSMMVLRRNYLTKWVDDVAIERKNMAKRMVIRPLSNHEFQVLGDVIKEGLVDICSKTYKCKVFNLISLSVLMKLLLA